MKNRISCFAVTAMLTTLMASPLWGAASSGETAVATVGVSDIGPSTTTQRTDALTESIVWRAGDPFAAMQDDGNRQPTCIYVPCRYDGECLGGDHCKCQGGSGPAPDPTAPPGGTGHCYSGPFSPPFPVVGYSGTPGDHVGPAHETGGSRGSLLESI